MSVIISDELKDKIDLSQFENNSPSVDLELKIYFENFEETFNVVEFSSDSSDANEYKNQFSFFVEKEKVKMFFMSEIKKVSICYDGMELYSVNEIPNIHKYIQNGDNLVFIKLLV